MHFEVLVEDQSGKKALEILLPKILGEDREHTFHVHSYKGIGRIPKNMRDARDASKRILLQSLPKLLKGYGRTFAGYPEDYPAVVIVVCDLDDRCLAEFRKELLAILKKCAPRPRAQLCFAIEEGEAWFLGDLTAVCNAYPRADRAVLDSYENDSICGTWEKLADAVYPGGAQALSSRGWQAVGAEKSTWAELITPFMNVDRNDSGSFCFFRGKVRGLAGIADNM